MTRTWPPQLRDLLTDMGQDPDGAYSSVLTDQLQMDLDAAVAYVQPRRNFNYTADPLDPRPAPPDNVWLGTVRLAKRWNELRRSGAGTADTGALGSNTRTLSVDADIQRMLGLGRYRGVSFA
jgi:hypothetical protein